MQHVKSLLRTLGRTLAGVATALAIGGAAPAPISVMAWEVRAPGARTEARPDYLVGTAHIPVPEGTALASGLEQAIGACDRFYMEADLDGVTQETVSRYILLDGEERLDAMLPAGAWKRLVAEAGHLGVTPEALKALEPWYVSLLLTLPRMDAERMLDSVLRAAAEQRKLPVGFLESPDEVLAAMDGVKRSEDVAMLLEALDDLPRQKRELDEIAVAYRKSDIAAIQRILFGDRRVERYPDYYERLLFGRNRLWLPKIEAALRDSDTMVAVGVGHLIGKGGLLEALGRKGYAIRAVKL